VGDNVTLPDGQGGILRYVGKIQGKPGEYAGVELTGEDAVHGRHSGSYNGMNYFTTTRPNSGVFITYSKLIASTSAANQNRPPATASVSRRQSARHSLQPPSTPMASQKATATGSPRGSLARPSVRGQALTTPRRSTAGLFKGTSPKPDDATTPSRRPRQSGLHQAMNHHNQDNEVATLTRELKEAREDLAEKDSQLEQQGQLLRDLEQSLEEFQTLANQRQEESNTNEEIEKLMRSLEDRDRKLTNLRAEFEEKRQEFRITIDGLQVEMQETSEMYESEIRALKANMGDAEEVNQRIVELEQMVTSLDNGLKNSQVSEQNARAQLGKLADIENKLLDKESELQDTRNSLEYFKSTNEELLKEVEHYKSLANSKKQDPASDQTLKSTDDSGEITRLQGEIENLESMLESKIFREQELEKQVESLKLRSSSSSTATFEGPTTPENNNKVTSPPAKVDPAAGRKLWCGLCEREGHESLDCPYDEEF
jgi:hypothetical protein